MGKAIKKQTMEKSGYNYCALPLAEFASHPDQSKGRIYSEPESEHRTCFQRDRDRLIHCEAFRRLKSKTQVFVYHQGDHYRTRLTHSLEVAQISRTIARALMVNEDLAETVALAHDLGHPPFAHSGEESLNECMKDVGGFDHNDQSLRVLTFLERKYPEFYGLNLSWETLEGVVKHNGPLVKEGKKAKLNVAIAALQEETDLGLSTYASIEAQIAALADDIAYNNHDVEDGLTAKLFTLEEARSVRILDDIATSIENKYGKLEQDLLIYQIIREMIGAMVTDVMAESRKRLAELGPENADDIRHAGHAVIAFSQEMHSHVSELRKFLWARMYRHHTVRRTMVKGGHVVRDLYNAFMDDKSLLPQNWQQRMETEGDGTKDSRARIIADYIASMTDRYAIREHEHIFDPYRNLR